MPAFFVFVNSIMIYYIPFYLLSVNIIAGIVFYSDKANAVRNNKRVPEKILHLMEFAGGVVLILPLIYLIRHKNRKRSYLIWTYLALFFWILLFFTWLFYW